jgi:hypothetical protein
LKALLLRPTLTPAEREWLETELLRPTREEKHFAEWFLKHQAPLDDPIVAQRLPTRKELNGIDAGVDARARASWARVQAEGRLICGSAGPRVADVLITAVTKVDRTPHDRREHSQDRNERRRRLRRAPKKPF